MLIVAHMMPTGPPGMSRRGLTRHTSSRRCSSGGVIRIGRVVGVVGRDGILPDVWD